MMLVAAFVGCHSDSRETLPNTASASSSGLAPSGSSSQRLDSLRSGKGFRVQALVALLTFQCVAGDLAAATTAAYAMRVTGAGRGPSGRRAVV